MRKLFHLLCAFVLCLQLCGGHLGMLQIVAWSGMMVRFAQSDGVAEAARKTFDGEHKCKLCRAIDASREAEQKQKENPNSTAPDWSKFGKELISLAALEVPVRLDAVGQWLPATEPRWLWPADPVSPPNPPPRAA